MRRLLPWCSWPCTQDGSESVGMTAAEFVALMGKLLAEVRSRARPFLEYFPLGYVVVSSDNHSCHKQWQRLQDPARLNAIPANSPDIHKIVEHPLNPFNTRWYARFTADLSCKSCESGMHLAAQILREHKATSIEDDLQTLPDTLQAIIERRGDWAPATLC